jgi:hypothetical protein
MEDYQINELIDAINEVSSALWQIEASLNAMGAVMEDNVTNVNNVD